MFASRGTFTSAATLLQAQTGVVGQRDVHVVVSFLSLCRHLDPSQAHQMSFKEQGFFLWYHLVSHGQRMLQRTASAMEGETTWQQRRMKAIGLGITERKIPSASPSQTLGLVSIAQDGFVAAQVCAKKNPRRAKRLDNLAETLLSAAMVVLRHEEAVVPQEVMAAISELTEALRAPVVRKQRRV